MKKHSILAFVPLLLILFLQYSAAKTITKHETIEEPNGSKITRMESWTHSVDDGEEGAQFPVLDKSFRLNNDELLKETAAAKGMDTSAIDELLRRNGTVVRNFTDEHGYKHTTNYVRTPEGGIASSTRIEKTGSVPLSELLRHGGEVPGVGPIPIDDILKPNKPISRSFVENSNDIPTQVPYWRQQPMEYRRPEQEKSQSLSDTAHDINKDVEVFSPRRTTSTATTWPRTSVFDNPTYWPVSPFDFNNKRHDPADPDVVTKQTSTTDDDGNTVTTKWTTRTYTYPTLPRIIPSATPTFTSYFTTTTAKPNTFITSATVEPTNALKPTKTFSLDDLPVTEVLQNGKPVDTNFIQRLPEGFRPVSQDEFTSTKTIKIDNIPMTGVSPQTSQLSPEVQDALNKAGITPDEISSSNGEPIVRTRVEPDGKVVRTTFRVQNVPNIVHADRPFDDFKPVNFPTRDFGNDFDLVHKHDFNNWLLNTSNKPILPFVPTTTTPPTVKPEILEETHTLPVSWQWKLVPELGPIAREQLQKAGISNQEIQGSYGRPIVKTRLDPNGRIVRTVYNLRDLTREPSEISDYLRRVDLHPDDILLRNGHGITKTITEDNGNVLTANFRLSRPLPVGSNNAAADLTQKSLSKPWK